MTAVLPFADLLDVDGRVPLLVHEHAGDEFDPGDGAIHLALDRTGALATGDLARFDLARFDLARFDLALTVAADPPAPWLGVTSNRLDARLARLAEAVAHAPIAALLLMRVLRIGEGLPFDAALEVESLAYSTLLGSAEFARWRAASPAGALPPEPAEPVRYERDCNTVTLTLASPATRNAMSATMRDALYAALASVVEDPGNPSLILRGEGRCFSTGGELAEFGSARDPAAAHLVRTRRSAARLLHRLGDRAQVRLHGACIGSGIEIAAAAARRVAAPDTIFQLPELRMGLIPGAGGTVTLARAIGRQRTAWLALSGRRIGAVRARDWGLIHDIVP